ncbi:gup1 [Symbiodinium sp. CCMP2592]|nr:gup1 [Symbiodinium sp. CCMP2592]
MLRCALLATECQCHAGLTFDHQLSQQVLADMCATIQPQIWTRATGFKAFFAPLLQCLEASNMAAAWSLCWVPVWAIGRSATYLQLQGRADLLVCYAMLLLIAMWLKFLCIWRFARLWALCDGIDVPENMQRCVCNNYSLSGFWRGWHASFNRWLVRYLYIPLGGRGLLWANVWIVFGFVVVEHLVATTRRRKAASFPADVSRWLRAGAGDTTWDNPHSSASAA